VVTAPNSPAYNSLWQVRTDSWCGLEESATQLVLATTHRRPTEKLAEILVTKGRMQTAAGLTERCRHYTRGASPPADPPETRRGFGPREPPDPGFAPPRVPLTRGIILRG